MSRQNGHAIQYVQGQTDEICLEAVRQNGFFLQNIRSYLMGMARDFVSITRSRRMDQLEAQGFDLITRYVTVILPRILMFLCLRKKTATSLFLLPADIIAQIFNRMFSNLALADMDPPRYEIGGADEIVFNPAFADRYHLYEISADRGYTCVLRDKRTKMRHMYRMQPIDVRVDTLDKYLAIEKTVTNLTFPVSVSDCNNLAQIKAIPQKPGLKLVMISCYATVALPILTTIFCLANRAAAKSDQNFEREILYEIMKRVYNDLLFTKGELTGKVTPFVGKDLLFTKGELNGKVTPFVNNDLLFTKGLPNHKLALKYQPIGLKQKLRHPLEYQPTGRKQKRRRDRIVDILLRRKRFSNPPQYKISTRITDHCVQYDISERAPYLYQMVPIRDKNYKLGQMSGFYVKTTYVNNRVEWAAVGNISYLLSVWMMFVLRASLVKAITQKRNCLVLHGKLKCCMSCQNTGWRM